MTSLESRFVAFRTHHDPEALADVFTACAPRLRALGARLENAIAPDDLVQTTFVRAIERAQEFDAHRQLMPWLCGILAHVVKEERRRTRRAQATPLTDRASRDDTVLAASGRELRAALDAALDALPATYRDVVTKRVVEGMGAADIAGQSREPVATIRARLQRGLRLLRQRLPHGLGVSLAAWLAGHARAATANRRVGALAPGAVILFFAALLFATLLTVPFVTTGTNDEIAPSDSAISTAYAAVAPGPRRKPPSPTRIAVATARRGFALRGQLDDPSATWAETTVAAYQAMPDDMTLPIAWVAGFADDTAMADVIARRRPETPVLARTAVDALGRFEFESLPTRDVRLVLEHGFRALPLPYVARASDESETTKPVSLRWFEGAHVYGNVDATMRGARVTAILGPMIGDDDLRHLAWRAAGGRLATRVREDGSFVFRGVPPCRELDVWVETGSMTAHARAHDVEPGSSHALSPTRTEASIPDAPAPARHPHRPDLDLRVVAAESGSPIPRFAVVLRRTDGEAVALRTARANARGVARITEVPGDAATLEIRAPGYGPVRRDVHALDNVLSLDKLTQISGVVRDQNGHPASGAVVWARTGDLGSDMPVHRDARVRADACGRFTTAVVPGPILMLAELEDGSMVTREVDAPPGSRREIELLAGGPCELHGRWFGDARATVATLISEFGRAMPTKLQPDGHFALRGFARGRYRLVIHRDGERAPLATYPVTAHAGTRIDLPPLAPSSILDGLEVVVRNGPADAVSIQSADGTTIGPIALDAAGIAHAQVPTGEYSLHAWCRGRRVGAPSTVRVGPGATRAYLEAVPRSM